MNFYIRILFFGLLVNFFDLELLRAAECYSCMSGIYEASFDRLGHKLIYNRPLSFGDFCEDPLRNSKEIPRKDCQSNCVTLVETINWGLGGYGFIRGCYDNLFKHGFNSSGIIGRMKYADYCASFNFTSLMQRPPYNWQDTKIRFCSCKGHMCNIGASNAANFTFETITFLLMGLFLLLQL